ncbi:MAG: PHP domain-containing protein [Clostridia bacterium]|nr:PHP domain-containing protein [Clostridia bacterium]
MPYLYEMHLHTAQTSPCARVGAKEAALAYKKGGYSGIVVTDHFTPNTFTAGTWEEKTEFFLKGYRAAKEAEDASFSVMLGMEIRFPANGNDFLLYGLTEEFLRQNPDINLMELDSFLPLAHDYGILVFQAHPFRDNMCVVRPDRLDGIEVFNANRRHDSRNSIAKMWASLYRMKTVSGSDFHVAGDACRGGIYTAEEIRDSVQLASVLRSGNYTCKVVR